MKTPDSRKDLAINADTRGKLSLFVDLLLEWNARINLTGFGTRAEIEERLIEESVRALEVLWISGLRVLDFGSGAGIPGIVWAACEPSAVVTSLEIRQKKIAFQKEALRFAGIRAEIVQGRFPEAVAGRQFDVIVTRAIRFSPSLWKPAVSLLAPGGRLVRFASAGSREEGWDTFDIGGNAALLVQTAGS